MGPKGPQGVLRDLKEFYGYLKGFLESLMWSQEPKIILKGLMESLWPQYGPDLNGTLRTTRSNEEFWWTLKVSKGLNNFFIGLNGSSGISRGLACTWLILKDFKVSWGTLRRPMDLKIFLMCHNGTDLRDLKGNWGISITPEGPQGAQRDFKVTWVNSRGSGGT